MSTENDVIWSSNLENIDFGSGEAPAGFDPNAGFRDLPEGRHTVRLLDYGFSADLERQNHRDIPGGFWVGRKITVRMGNDAGSIVDYLPCPTPESPMPVPMANRWANFLRSWGFDIPPDRVIPAGFHHSQLRNTPGLAQIDVVVEEYEGKRRHKVKYMSYQRAPKGTAPGVVSASSAKPAPTQAPSTKPAPQSSGVGSSGVGVFDDL